MATESLRDIRKTRNLSQAQIARAAGITRVYYTLIENGQRSPSPRVLKAIANVLGMSMDDVFALIGQRPAEVSQ